MVPKRSTPQAKPYSIFLSLLTCSLLLVSCGAPASTLLNSLATPPASPTPLVALASPVVAQPSATPETSTDTPTALPASPTPVPATDTPTTVPPTAAPAGTAVPAIPTGNFSLAAGTTAAALNGTVQAGQTVSYTLGAAQSQPITLILDSPSGNVSLAVQGPDGKYLLDPSFKQTAWQYVLPSTGLYTLQVVGGATKADFSLTVKTPQVVSLGSAASTLNGSTANGYLYSYAVNVSAGQTLSASLNVPASSAILDIYGITSGTVLSDSLKVNSWSGALPVSDTYVVEVVPVNAQVVSYALTLSATLAAAGTPGASGTISFAPGTTASVVHGTVPAGQTVTYTVQADKNQPMILFLDSPHADLTLGVLNPDGTILLDPAQKWSYWQWQLPTTGLYTIQVIGGKAAENYTLTVKVAELVYFPGEPKTITLHGNTYPGYVHSYAFRLSAGVHLTVTLSDPSGEAYIDIFGIESGALLSWQAGDSSWSGNVPETEEVVVEVVPHNNASAVYSLTVSVP